MATVQLGRLKGPTSVIMDILVLCNFCHHVRVSFGNDQQASLWYVVALGFTYMHSEDPPSLPPPFIA